MAEKWLEGVYFVDEADRSEFMANVDSLRSRQKIDVLIAGRVFGCKPVFEPRSWDLAHGRLASPLWVCTVTNHKHPEPDAEHCLEDEIAGYSYDMNTAMCVVAKMRELGFNFYLNDTTDHAWVAEFFTMTSEDGAWSAVAVKPSMAICLSALKALGVKA